MLSGILLVDKPPGPTSHGVVAEARRRLGIKKIGHAGTLDPMASGLLTLGVGPGTKLLTFLVGSDKTYTATIRLGVATHTDDAEGEVIFRADDQALAGLSPQLISGALNRFRGEIPQVPSSVSAVKIDGKRAYQRVLEGEEVDIPPRKVRVHRIDVFDIRHDEREWEVDVEIECSSGTYIRAIARDLGQSLGVGGHLVALRRVTVGPFNVADAVSAETISPNALLSLADVAKKIMPVVRVSPAQASDLQHGRRTFLEHPEGGLSDNPVACIDSSGRLVAIVRVEEGVSRILVGLPEHQEEGQSD